VLSPRWAWPPDKWERLSTVARLADDATTVLDVGGRGRELQRLLPGVRVRSLNVEEPADVVISRGPLPYEDGAFDVVTSCDVLEHVPREERAGHLTELVRVAKRRVVACFPAGSPRKDGAEQALHARLRDEYGVRFAFLDEHLERGLPRAADVTQLIRDADPRARVTVWFQDGIDDRDRVLVDAVRARRRADPLAAARVARAWLVRPAPVLTTTVSVANNRAYVVAELG
jgi:hypothetical protein